MIAPRPSRRDSLRGRLESVPGLSVEAGAPLARLTTFRIGGSAELLVRVATLRALACLQREVSGAGAPLLLLGLGSNLLVPDEGLRGVVARLGGELARIRRRGTLVSAGGAAPLARLARRTVDAGLGGLEALSGFPSTVGGAVVMNAGCYGTEIKDRLLRALVVERSGELRRWSTEELRPGYRSTALQGAGGVVARALFRLEPADPAVGSERIRELNRRRWASLPSGQGNAGSVFRNPEGRTAGRLIDECGLKGERRGDAQISPRHANVIVNLGRARALDVLELMVVAHRAVRERFGVRLEPEVVLAGVLAERWRRAVAPVGMPGEP